MPLYSPFLNSIEECWAKIKLNTKLHSLSENYQLPPRVTTACNTVSVEDCQGWIRRSVSFWGHYLYKK
ncbi:hypothetical protein BJ944DRAFT_204164 [Cunninghamella echinulata]|nr:hypothetical protein BJ944DRAFT_204164 [Cunninghamella echinulata]